MPTQTRSDLLRPDVAAAIEQAWPDRTIEMPFESEESWFWDMHPKLARAFQQLDRVRLFHERGAEGVPLWTEF